MTVKRLSRLLIVVFAVLLCVGVEAACVLAAVGVPGHTLGGVVAAGVGGIAADAGLAWFALVLYDETS